MCTHVLGNYNNGMTVEIIDLEVMIVGSHWKVKPAGHQPSSWISTFQLDIIIKTN